MGAGLGAVADGAAGVGAIRLRSEASADKGLGAVGRLAAGLGLGWDLSLGFKLRL